MNLITVRVCQNIAHFFFILLLKYNKILAVIILLLKYNKILAEHCQNSSARVIPE